MRAKKLLHTLLDAVEALQPPAGTSASSRAWRSYHLLSLRYVEALDVRSVMQRLAISKTQYQREHARALEALASLLRDRWHLPEPPPGVSAEGASAQSLALREAADLLAHTRAEFVDLREAVAEILAILEPVTRQRRVTPRLRKGSLVPPVHADRIAIRRVFLSLFHQALAASQGGELEVSFSGRERRAEVTVRALPGTGGQATPEATTPQAEVIGSFLEALAGTLDFGVDHGTGAWVARVTLPAASLPLLLVVDNNQEFVQLVKRFLAGHGWQVEGAGSVEEAHALTRELRPRVVLLDVMLPGQDGWDLLLALRKDSATRATTVIVCSVLSEPLVAESLGAVAYLPKPVSQQALLSALAPYQ
jgi:CheY-like chemotaxis protein